MGKKTQIFLTEELQKIYGAIPPSRRYSLISGLSGLVVKIDQSNFLGRWSHFTPTKIKHTP